MGWTMTITGLVIAIAVFGWANWRARQPVQFGRVRMIPYTALMFAALVVILLMVAHVFTLLGVEAPPRQGLGYGAVLGHTHFTLMRL